METFLPLLIFLSFYAKGYASGFGMIVIFLVSADTWCFPTGWLFCSLISFALSFS